MKNEEDPCIHDEDREMNSKREIYLIICLSILFLFLPTLLYALIGYDYDTEDYDEIHQELSAIQGRDISIYDYSDESLHLVHVISVKIEDDDVEIKVYDLDVNEYWTFEMDVETDDQHKNEETKEDVLT